MKKFKASKIKQAEIEAMTDVSKFIKLKLEKSTPRSTVYADEVFGKMIATEIKQLPDNVKPPARYKLNGVTVKCQMHSNQIKVEQFIFPPVTPLYLLHQNIVQLPV